jgi:rubredoxin
MKKRQITCYKGFASLQGKFNVEVYYTVPDMGYWNKLFTCLACGEVFVADLENPIFAGKPVEQAVDNMQCPTCGSQLGETLRAYPESFRTEDGRTGQYEPERRIPSATEGIVREFYEIGG